MLRVQQLRLTYAWSATTPGLLDGAAHGAQAPAITFPADYVRAFDAVRNATATPGGGGPWPDGTGGPTLTLPWPPRGGPMEVVNVWARALGSRDYDSLSSQRFWRAQIPLAAPRPPLRLAQDSAETAVSGTALCHPLGNSVAVTAVVSGDLDPGGLAERVADLDQSARFRLADGHTTRTYPLRTLGPELLRRLHTHRGGAGTGEPALDPFVVATVVRADPHGTDDACRATEGGAVHHLLHALATRTRLTDCPVPSRLADRSLQGRTHQGGGVLYRLPRTRVVWAPYRFRRVGRSRWLGCYHHNLALASMLTDAWLGVTGWAADTIAEGPLAPGAFEVAERCAALLGLVYEENPRPAPVYRTRSMAAQIVDSGLVPALQDVRGYVGALRELKPASLTPG